MADSNQPLCASSVLENGGTAFVFEVAYLGQPQSAFAIRYQGQAHAYLNRCAHVPMELDWQAGQFFEDDKRYLMCATHGAIYEPDSGICVGGPCRGSRLVKIELIESSASIAWLPSERIQPLF
jgi:nitrite reductase/ring-hydroxylating ferredoxin subunit